MNRRALSFGISKQDGVYFTEFLLRHGYIVSGTSHDAELSSFQNMHKLGVRQPARPNPGRLGKISSRLHEFDGLQDGQANGQYGKNSFILNQSLFSAGDENEERL